MIKEGSILIIYIYIYIYIDMPRIIRRASRKNEPRGSIGNLSHC